MKTIGIISLFIAAIILTLGLYDYLNRPKLVVLSRVKIGTSEKQFIQLFNEEKVFQQADGCLQPDIASKANGLYQLRLRKGGNIGLCYYLVKNGKLEALKIENRYIRLNSLMDPVWRVWWGLTMNEKDLDIPVETVQRETNVDYSAQQVDSAEPSTYAVPPSMPSGSAR